MPREVLELFTCCVAPPDPRQMGNRPRITADMIGNPENFQHISHVGATDANNFPASSGSPASSSSGSPSRNPSPSSDDGGRMDGSFGGAGGGPPREVQRLTLQMNSKGNGLDTHGNRLSYQPVHVPHLVNARSVNELRRVNTARC